MFKSWRKAVAIVAVAGGLGAVGTTAAQAANYNADCPSTYICVYNSSNFQDQLSRYVAPFALRNLSASHINKMSSWQNHSTHYGAWYGLSDGGGPCLEMASQTVNSYVGLYWNDTMNSWQGNGGC